MKCVLKKKENDSYFCKNIGFQNHWTYFNEAKIFETVKEARKIIKKYNISNVEVVKCSK